MQQDAFDLAWLALLMLGSISLPIVLGLIATFTERK